MIPVREVMPAALEDLLHKAPLTPEKVAFAWRLTVGAAVGRATSIELRDRVLRVRVKAPAWQREVERAAGRIRTRLNALLGEGVVGSLDVVVGPQE